MRAKGRGAPAQSATADREVVISRSTVPSGSWCSRRSPRGGTCRGGGGPEGFTTTTRAFEFRAGGEWYFVDARTGRDGLPGVDLLTEIAPAGAWRSLRHGESRGDPNAFESVHVR